MQALQSISKRILAALTMFTRLPLWRLCNIEAEYYKQVVPLWPLAGWLTGGRFGKDLLERRDGHTMPSLFPRD